MATIMSFDAMLSADEGDEVQVGFEIDGGSVFVDFAVGEDEDEITFAFALSDAARWEQAFRRAAQLTELAAIVGTYSPTPATPSPNPSYCGEAGHSCAKCAW